MLNLWNLFDLKHTQAGAYLSDFVYPWQGLPGLEAFLWDMGQTLESEYETVAAGVWIHRTASVSPAARVDPPCIIGRNTQVRHGAYIRGSVLAGENCVIGNSTELKNTILFNGVQVPHYNYVGDSILGYGAHLGAGAVVSNVRADKSSIAVQAGAARIETGLRKLGALIGDQVEIGCNAVLNPGTVVGKNSVIQPVSCVRGSVPEDSIWKTSGAVVRKEVR